MSLQLCVRGVRGREKGGGGEEEGEGEGGEGGGGRLLKAFPRVDMEGDCSGRLTSNSGFPVSLVRAPNSRRRVPAHAVHVVLS